MAPTRRGHEGKYETRGAIIALQYQCLAIRNMAEALKVPILTCRYIIQHTIKQATSTNTLPTFSNNIAIIYDIP